MVLNTIKTAILLMILTMSASATLYIGSIQSEDISEQALYKINEVFLDVWSEKSVFNRISDVPKDDLSRFVRSLNLNVDDQLVTGYILQLGDKSHLRVDVYNADGARIHVSREVITAIEEVYIPMISTREKYYSPIEENGEGIESSSSHKFGWSLTLGAVKPFNYRFSATTPEGVDTLIDPHSFALTDLALHDMVGKYRDIVLSLFIHYNWRADIGIGMGAKKVFLKNSPHAPYVGLEAGLNKLIIEKFMGEDDKKNYVGTTDGIMITPKVGALFFRDQKINMFTEFGYTYIASERNAQYLQFNFGVMSSWGKRK